MANQKPAETFMPPNTLKQKIDASLLKLDDEAVARAERALAQLSTQFEAWIDEELEKLEAAWAQVREEGIGGEAGETLFRCAHDLKGLGATYELTIHDVRGRTCRRRSRRTHTSHTETNGTRKM